MVVPPPQLAKRLALRRSLDRRLCLLRARGGIRDDKARLDCVVAGGGFAFDPVISRCVVSGESLATLVGQAVVPDWRCVAPSPGLPLTRHPRLPTAATLRRRLECAGSRLRRRGKLPILRRGWSGGAQADRSACCAHALIPRLTHATTSSLLAAESPMIRPLCPGTCR